MSVPPPATGAAPNPNAELPALIEKARAVTAKVGRLKQDFAGAHRLAHQAQVREALTRTELTLALHESLTARAEQDARLREAALAAYQARNPERLRRHNRLSRMLDRLLMRLGPRGQALVIARSRVWRREGPLRDHLRRIIAYVRRGADPEAQPSAPFDQAWYLAAHPDLAGLRVSPLAHYLTTGDREGRRFNPLFDEAWYRGLYGPEINAHGLSVLEHYVRAGAPRGFGPQAMFDAAHYLAQAPMLAPGQDVLSHYMAEGAAGGLSPHPLFDPAWYIEQAPSSAASPFAHYLARGWREGLSPHPLFDPRWYLSEHPELKAAGVEPLTHFVTTGGFQGFSPSPWFDLGYYGAMRGAAAPPGVNALIDYLRGGAWAVAEARPGFPTAAYLASRPDLVRAGLTPLEHWARRGGR